MACSSPVTVSRQVPAYSTPTPTPQGQKPGQPGQPYKVNDYSAGLGYNASLTIAWSPASNTSYYNVIDPYDNRTIASNISGTQYTIPNLYSGATIHLAIVAVNQYGQTQGPTNQFILPCPSGYTATGKGCQQNVQVPAKPSAFDCSSYESSNLSTEVDLCWNIDPNVDHYLVRDNWGFGGGLGGPGANVGYTGIAHLTGVTPGASVQAQVAGVNSAGQGPWSDIVTMYTQAASSAPSQSIYAWDCSGGQPAGCIRCCFSGAPPNASEITIQHVDASGNILGILQDWVQSSTPICGLYAGPGSGIIHWQVRAYDNSGNLVAWSNIVQSDSVNH